MRVRNLRRAALARHETRMRMKHYYNIGFNNGGSWGTFKKKKKIAKRTIYPPFTIKLEFLLMSIVDCRNLINDITNRKHTHTKN
jgi:hypothetical protein